MRFRCASSLEDIYEVLKDESNPLLSLSLSLWSFSSLNRLHAYSTACAKCVLQWQSVTRMQSGWRSWKRKVGKSGGHSPVVLILLENSTYLPFYETIKTNVPASYSTRMLENVHAFLPRISLRVSSI